MIAMRVLLCCLLSIALQSASAQQTYQKRGNNYHAAVTIQRDTQNPYANAPRQPFQNQQNVKPWRQGDRLTKQELIQNIAKALLTRKKTPSERKEEERKRNEMNMQEYLMIKAGLAGKAHDQAPNNEAINQPPPAPQPQVAVPGQNPNTYNVASSQQFGQAPTNFERQNIRNYQNPGGNNRFASQTGDTFQGNRPGSMNNMPRHSQGQRQFNGGASQRGSQQFQPKARVYMPRRQYMS